MSEEMQEFNQDFAEHRARQLPELLIDVHALAEALGVPVTWCYRAAEKKEIPSTKVGKKYLRFRLSDVLTAFENNETARTGGNAKEMEIDNETNLQQRPPSGNNA